MAQVPGQIVRCASLRVLLAILAVTGCPSEEPEHPGSDAGQQGCTPACQQGLVCSGGQCLQPSVDEDGDGFPAVLDCDDRDPDVEPGSTRTCAPDCGEGTQVCVQGRWSDCTAPADCSCEPDDMCCPASGDDRCAACPGNARRDCRDDCTWGGCISTGKQC